MSTIVGATASAITGIRGAEQRLADVAKRVAGDPDPARYPEDAVAMKESVAAVKANTAVIKAADEMVGSLLDELG